MAVRAAQAQARAQEADVDAANNTPSNNTNDAQHGKTVRVTLVRSSIGFPKDQRATLRAIGLSRLHQTLELPDSPQLRGQIFKVKHLLEVG